MTYDMYQLSSSAIGSHYQPLTERRFGATSAHAHKYAHKIQARRTLNDAGLNTQASSVDEVVFGVDLDGSADEVEDVRSSKHFFGAGGKTSKKLGEARHTIQARTRIAGLNTQASDVDEVVFGRDLDDSGAEPVGVLRQHPKFKGAYGRPSKRESHELEYERAPENFSVVGRNRRLGERFFCQNLSHPDLHALLPSAAHANAKLPSSAMRLYENAAGKPKTLERGQPGHEERVDLMSAGGRADRGLRPASGPAARQPLLRGGALLGTGDKLGEVPSPPAPLDAYGVGSAQLGERPQRMSSRSGEARSNRAIGPLAACYTHGSLTHAGVTSDNAADALTQLKRRDDRFVRAAGAPSAHIAQYQSEGQLGTADVAPLNARLERLTPPRAFPGPLEQSDALQLGREQLVEAALRSAAIAAGAETAASATAAMVAANTPEASGLFDRASVRGFVGAAGRSSLANNTRPGVQGDGSSLKPARIRPSSAPGAYGSHGNPNGPSEVAALLSDSTADDAAVHASLVRSALAPSSTAGCRSSLLNGRNADDVTQGLPRGKRLVTTPLLAATHGRNTEQIAVSALQAKADAADDGGSVGGTGKGGASREQLEKDGGGGSVLASLVRADLPPRASGLWEAEEDALRDALASPAFERAAGTASTLHHVGAHGERKPLSATSISRRRLDERHQSTEGPYYEGSFGKGSAQINDATFALARQGRKHLDEITRDVTAQAQREAQLQAAEEARAAHALEMQTRDLRLARALASIHDAAGLPGDATSYPPSHAPPPAGLPSWGAKLKPRPAKPKAEAFRVVAK